MANKKEKFQPSNDPLWMFSEDPRKMDGTPHEKAAKCFDCTGIKNIPCNECLWEPTWYTICPRSVCIPTLMKHSKKASEKLWPLVIKTINRGQPIMNKEKIPNT